VASRSLACNKVPLGSSVEMLLLRLPVDTLGP